MEKVTQERYNKSRERSDKISALMGQYMLKGYRMLGSSCEVCGNVLLKYRDQEDYCVACREVDVPSATAPDHHVGIDHHVGMASVSETTPAKSSSTSQNAISRAVQAVNEKILWASQALNSCQSTGECQQLCELLKTCAETLRALQEIQH